jgi:hypothetical protein
MYYAFFWRLAQTTIVPRMGPFGLSAKDAKCHTPGNDACPEDRIKLGSRPRRGPTTTPASPIRRRAEDIAV